MQNAIGETINEIRLRHITVFNNNKSKKKGKKIQLQDKLWYDLR